MENYFNILTSTTTLINSSSEITGYEVKQTDLGAVHAIIGILIAITIITMAIWPKK
jgi:hypothetical protein